MLLHANCDIDLLGFVVLRRFEVIYRGRTRFIVRLFVNIMLRFHFDNLVKCGTF